MTFRTNQPGSALESLSAFWELSMQNRAMDLRPNSILNGTTLSIFVLAFELSLLLFQSTHSTQIGSGGPGFCLYQAAAAPPPQPQHGGAAP